MRWHFAVLVLGCVALVAHGHPIEKDEQTSLEESFADGEETEVDRGKKKSSLDSAMLEKDEKQETTKGEVNNESRIEKLIDDISDSRSAETSERYATTQTTIEEFSARGSADKKDEVNINDDEEGEQTGDKKEKIAKTEDDKDESEDAETVKPVPAEKSEKKEEVNEPEEEGDKKDAEVTDYDEDVTEEDVTKKDDIKPATTKEKEDKEKDTKSKKDKKATAQKKGEDNPKKWWMVEGAHKWGGMGHSHWGPPHKTETETEHKDEGHFTGPESEGAVKDGSHGESHGESKSHVATCCKGKDKNARKRCGCPHHEEGEKKEHKGGEHHKVKEHEDGYHFHDKGGGHAHNNDHDHELRGPWSFGYDGFGDDWGDWDHNHGEYGHLKDLEQESHGGHHEEVHEGAHGEAKEGEHGEDCKEGSKKRQCVLAPVDADDDGIDAPFAAAQEAFGAQGATVAMAPLPVPGGLPGPGGLSGPGPGAMPYAMPMPMPVLPPPVRHGHALPYRVCHACHVLPDGGSRCLCKALRHHHGHHPHVHHANTHFNHHVYVDCDAAVHSFPMSGHLCRPRHDLPTPEHTQTSSGGKS